MAPAIAELIERCAILGARTMAVSIAVGAYRSAKQEPGAPPLAEPDRAQLAWMDRGVTVLSELAGDAQRALHAAAPAQWTANLKAVEARRIELLAREPAI